MLWGGFCAIPIVFVALDNIKKLDYVEIGYLTSIWWKKWFAV